MDKIEAEEVMYIYVFTRYSLRSIVFYSIIPKRWKIEIESSLKSHYF